MLVSSRLVASLGPALALVLLASHAAAQPTGALPTGGPPPGGEEEEKPEGIAEAAPKSAGLLATTPTVPPRRDARKKFEVFRLDGFLRARGDWMKNLNLGFSDSADFGGAPFRQPLHCLTEGTLVTSCDDTTTSSNLKLRLEPRIELTNQIAVHSQIDLLDNVVLGAAQPPELGVNAGNDSIVVRRAWAEVATALLLIKFGRMPDHFGMGIVANSGRRRDSDYATWETMWMPSAEADVGGINDTAMDLDTDYGDTVDRASVSLEVPGTPLRALASYDWPHNGAQDDRVGRHFGQLFDLDDIDDTSQWMIAIGRMDSPGEFREKMDRGELAYNFGGRLVRTTLDYDFNAAYNNPDVPDTEETDADRFVKRGSSLWRPDVWFKIGWKGVLFEGEGAASVGSIANIEDLNGNEESIDVRAFGGVVRISSTAFEKKLGYGLEVGFASGDDGEAEIQGRTHLSGISPYPAMGDGTLSRFAFNPDYEVDLILFRELIGAVSNALYFRPRMSYQLTKSIMFRAQNVTSAAHKPVSTPGNSTFWGTEFDTELEYRSGGFNAGLAYGVLFPLGGMDHPTSDGTGTGFPFGTNLQNAGTAENAHSFQLRLAVEF